MTYFFELLFLLLLIVIADVQARMIADNKPINHLLWGSLFAAIIAAGWYLSEMNYWFAGALIVEHFVFFSPVLNKLRSPKETFFYIHSDPQKGSIWDTLLKPVDKYYPFIWAAGLASFAALQFFL